MKEYKVHGDPTFRFCSLRNKNIFYGQIKKRDILVTMPRPPTQRKLPDN